MTMQPELRQLEISGGRVSIADDTIHLELPPVQRGYADAQVDDYAGVPRRRFPWRPPLHLSLSARASAAGPLGTLGFGFWNDPFSFSLGGGGAARRLPAPPQALWFFYGSPPNDMRFLPEIPTHGWKASSLRSPSLSPLLLAPLAGVAVGLAQLHLTRRRVMQAALGMVAAAEAPIQAPLNTWERYQLSWTEHAARFYVGGELVLTAPNPPSGPLGFVAWIDNQFAIASPEGGLRFGVLEISSPQWLEVRGLSIDTRRLPEL